jgi:hypothetical protein
MINARDYISRRLSRVYIYISVANPPHTDRWTSSNMPSPVLGSLHMATVFPTAVVALRCSSVKMHSKSSTFSTWPTAWVLRETGQWMTEIWRNRYRLLRHVISCVPNRLWKAAPPLRPAPSLHIISTKRTDDWTTHKPTHQQWRDEGKGFGSTKGHAILHLASNSSRGTVYTADLSTQLLHY